MIDVKKIYVGDLFIERNRYNSDYENLLELGFDKNDERRKKYLRYFTLFFKVDNNYLCLENGLIYSSNKDGLICNLYPLQSFLQRRDEQFIECGNTDDILTVYKNVFLSNRLPLTIKSIYKYKINDVYFGNFIVNSYFMKNGIAHYNTALNLLYNRSYCYAQTLTRPRKASIVKGEFDCSINSYYISPCIKTNNGFLNIHTNKFYSSMNESKSFKIIKPFDEVIFNNDKEYNLDAINDLYNKNFRKVLK